jgi:S-adenosylmethionine synthetase
MFCIHDIPNKLNSVLEIVEGKGIGHPDSYF